MGNTGMSVFCDRSFLGPRNLVMSLLCTQKPCVRVRPPGGGGAGKAQALESGGPAALPAETLASCRL